MQGSLVSEEICTLHYYVLLGYDCMKVAPYGII